MIESCENCHYQRIYQPKTQEPEGYPRLCYNCFIKAEGLTWYIARQIKEGIDPEAAIHEALDGADQLQRSTADSMLRIFQTMADYWERVAEGKPTAPRPIRLRRL